MKIITISVCLTLSLPRYFIDVEYQAGGFKPPTRFFADAWFFGYNFKIEFFPKKSTFCFLGSPF